MPERLDSVTVATSRHEVVLPWASRVALLDRLWQIPSAASIVAAFEAVGAYRPVILSGEQEATLHEVVEQWEHEVGAHNLPASIDLLRDALRSILVAYSRGVVEIPWATRNELLARLEGDPAAAGAVTTFMSTGGSAPVQLTDDQIVVLDEIIDVWLQDVGMTRLPPGVFRLHNALKDHLHDTHLHG